MQWRTPATVFRNVIKIIAEQEGKAQLAAVEYNLEQATVKVPTNGRVQHLA